MAVRLVGNDFIRDVRAQSNAAKGVVYVAALNTDNVSFNITRNGVKTYATVYWNAQGSSAQTDAGGVNQDTVTIMDNGTAVPGSAQQFINSLV